jgi:ABC-type antimicrobial peptide transport system permease subunit
MITSADRRDRPPVAIINESMARALWPHEDAIGKRFTPDDPTPTWVEVVGVVGDVRFPAATSSSIDTEYQIYIPLAVGAPAVASIIVRTAAPSESIAANLTRVVAGLDRDVAVVGLTTARAFEARTTASLRLLANVLGGFAALGLILATIGIFGVVSYSTAQRTGELGMRMALGARQSEVLWLVLRQGVALTLAGTVAGLIGGLGLARLLAAIMPRLPSPETLLVVTIAVGMTLIALLAMYIPARRASKISPMIALRHES